MGKGKKQCKGEWKRDEEKKGKKEKKEKEKDKKKKEKRGKERTRRRMRRRRKEFTSAFARQQAGGQAGETYMFPHFGQPGVHKKHPILTRWAMADVHADVSPFYA